MSYIQKFVVEKLANETHLELEGLFEFISYDILHEKWKRLSLTACFTMEEGFY